MLAEVDDSDVSSAVLAFDCLCELKIRVHTRLLVDEPCPDDLNGMGGIRLLVGIVPCE